MGVKISELSELTSIDNNDRLIINHENQTYQGSLNTIIGDYLSNYLNENNYYITADNLGSYLYGSIGGSGYLNSYVTSNDLSDYLSNYTPQIDLSGYLSENSYITESYLNENHYITESYLNGYHYITEDYLSSYITEDYLSSNSYINKNNLSDTLFGVSGYLYSYITENYLNENDYLTRNNLSNFLFGVSGYLNEIYHSDGTVNFDAIYQGISSYFET